MGVYLYSYQGVSRGSVFLADYHGSFSAMIRLLDRDLSILLLHVLYETIL